MLSWNVRHLSLWDRLASEEVDLALHQEAPRPATDGVVEVYPGGLETWETAGWERRAWRTAIVRTSQSVTLEPIVSREIAGKDWQALQISRTGTITAAAVRIDEAVAFTAVSVYAPWDRRPGTDSSAWADGSAHRILSDLSPLLWDGRHHPVVVAGDLNILYGYGEQGDTYWARRYASVFEHAAALGLTFVGPQAPNGRPADPNEW